MGREREETKSFFSILGPNLGFQADHLSKGMTHHHPHRRKRDGRKKGRAATRKPKGIEGHLPYSTLYDFQEAMPSQGLRKKEPRVLRNSTERMKRENTSGG